MLLTKISKYSFLILHVSDFLITCFLSSTSPLFCRAGGFYTLLMLYFMFNSQASSWWRTQWTQSSSTYAGFLPVSVWFVLRSLPCRLRTFATLLKNGFCQFCFLEWRVLPMPELAWTKVHLCCHDFMKGCWVNVVWQQGDPFFSVLIHIYNWCVLSLSDLSLTRWGGCIIMPLPKPGEWRSVDDYGRNPTFKS